MLFPVLNRAAPTMELMGFKEPPPSPPSKSRSSSFSQSSASSRGSASSRKFHHHREPTVLDRPFAIEAMKNALLQDRADDLARLVRDYGLPPSMRSAAWPVLLRAHPYVLEARATAATAPAAINEKRIRGDIRRLRRFRGANLMEDAIFNAVHAYLEQWGARVAYDGAMVWIADFLVSGDGGLSESPGPVGASSSSSSTSSSSSGGSSSSSGSSTPTVSSGDARGEAGGEAGGEIGPESPVADAARFGDDLSQEIGFSYVGISGDLLPEVFANVMHVIHHSPAAYSEFVSTLRNALPLLSRHYANEGILADAAGGDDWLIWWLRWLGTRAFSASMLTRLWDEYFAFREQNGVTLMRQHLFTCVLIMRENRMRLLELDQSECRQYLGHIPPSRDVEALIKEARTLAAAAEAGADAQLGVGPAKKGS